MLAEGDIAQCRTAVERIVADSNVYGRAACIFPEGYRSKRRTVLEYIGTDSGNRCRDRNGRQTSGAERIVINLRYRRRNGDRRQTLTTIEGILTDGFYLFRDGKFADCRVTERIVGTVVKAVPRIRPT